jgi:PAS domain S-box-containing protein
MNKKSNIKNKNLTPDFFRQIAENLPGIVYRLHLQDNNRLQFLNRSAVTVTGYTEEELPGGEVCQIDPLILDEDRPRVIQEVKQALSECRPFSLQYRLRHKDGSIRYVLEQGNPEVGVSGKLLYVDGLILDITPFKTLQSKLHETDSRFRQLTDNIDDIFWLCNQDLTEIYYISPAYEKIWGKSCQSLYENPASFMESIHPDDKEKTTQKIRQTISKGYDEEYRIIRPDGSVRWIHDRAFPVKDRSRQIHRVAGIASDITGIKETEQNLREQSQIIDQIHDAVIATDLNGYVTGWNQGAEKLYGYAVDEAVGKHVSFLYSKKQHGFLQNEIIAPLKEKGSHQVEVALRNKGGKSFLVHLSLSLFRDESGNPRGMIGYGMDIDERKKAERESKEYASKLRAILESLSDGFFSLDKKWRYTYVNSQAASMVSKKKEELLNRSIWEVFPEAVGTTFDKMYRKVRREKKATSFVEFYQPLNKWFEVHVYPSTEGLTIYFQDVTQRIQNDQELRNYSERHNALSRLGQEALKGRDLKILFNQAINIAKKLLKMDYVKILELLPDKKQLLLIAGSGWKKGYIGNTKIPTQKNSQAGFTLSIGEPVVVEDFRQEKRFKLPGLLKEHRVRSGISVIIYGSDRPFGILGIHSRTPRNFKPFEVNFVQSVANILATAILRQETEHALRASEERFRSVFERSASGIVLVDHKGKFLQVNPEFCKFSGYSEKELLKLNIKDIICAEDLKETQSLSAALRQGNRRSFDIINRYKTKNGKIVWGHTTSSWIYDIKSRPLYGIGMIQDITPLIEVENALLDSEEKYRSLIESAPDAVIIMDENGKIILTNNHVKKIFGYRKEELVGRPIELLVPEHLHEVLKKYRKLFISNPKIQTLGSGLNMFGLHKSGQLFPVEASISPTLTHSGLTITSVVRDITTRKRTEEKLNRSREQLRNLSMHLQTMREEDREWISTKIHDEIGQNLIGMQMNLGQLASQIPVDDNTMTQRIDYIMSLISNSIEMVKNITTELRPRILTVLGLNEAVRWYLKEFKKNTGINFRCSFHPLDLELDPDISTNLYRIFQEAMSNIQKHSNASEVKVNLRKRENNLLLTIEDNGAGINQEQIDSPKSHGIMSMKERVQYIKGEMQIKGYADKGTKLRIMVPLLSL